MDRIDPLSFYDETKVGVNLLILIMCLIFYYGYGPFVLFHQIIMDDKVAASGVYDVCILVVLSLAIGIYRNVSRNIKYGVCPLPMDERAVNKFFEGVCRNLTAKNIRILTTSTMGRNAFYQYNLFRPYIVLEKGLLMSFNKGEDVSGVVAHECAHIVRKDAWYITYLLNFTYAFISLSLLKIITAEVHYWGIWLDYSFVLQGHLIPYVSYFLKAIPQSLFNVLYNVMFIIAVTLIARHFIRVRELLTDELAAQTGYRKSIIERLSQNKTKKYQLFSFHPGSESRKENLASGYLWMKVNYGLVFSLSFIIISAASLVSDNLFEFITSYLNVNDLDSMSKNIDDIVSDLYFTVGAGVLIVVISMVVMNHINRVSSSLIYKGVKLPSIFSKMILLFIVSLAGCLVSIFVKTGFIRDIYRGEIEGVSGVLSEVLPLLIMFSCYFSIALFSGVVASFLYMRVKVKSAFWRVAYLVTLWFIIYFLISTIAGAAFYYAGFSIQIRQFYFDLSDLIFPGVSALKDEGIKALPAMLALTPSVILLLLVIFALVPLPAKSNNRRMPYGLDNAKVMYTDKPYKKEFNHRVRFIRKIERPVARSAYRFVNFLHTERRNLSGITLALVVLGFGVLCIFTFKAVNYVYRWINPVVVVTKSKPVTAFQFDYTSGLNKGIRTWQRAGNGTWSEIYPGSVMTTKFTEVGKTIVKGCSGTVVTQSPNPQFRIFIPDQGCKQMWIWFEGQKGEWNYLGRMNNIS